MGLAWDASGETYEDVKLLIDSQVHKFFAYYGQDYVKSLCGPFEELRADCDQAFMTAYLSYKEEYGKFSSWVAYKVWKFMLDALRRGASRERVTARYRKEVESRPTTTSNFNLFTFMRSLPDDAREVVRLAILDTPGEVFLYLAEKRTNSPKLVRGALREYLRDLGWARRRVTESFRQIQEALRP